MPLKIRLKRPTGQAITPFVFSHPDYTVGCGIAPHQLALADLFGQDILDLPGRRSRR